MESGTITNSDGSTTIYDKLSGGAYYQYIEYRVDGSFVKTTWPDGTQSWGVYTYDDVTRSLSYKQNGFNYYVPATITVLSAKEMIISSNYGTEGMITQHMIKLFK